MGRDRKMGREGEGRWIEGGGKGAGEMERERKREGERGEGRGELTRRCRQTVPDRRRARWMKCCSHCPQTCS